MVANALNQDEDTGRNAIGTHNSQGHWVAFGKKAHNRDRPKQALTKDQAFDELQVLIGR